MERAEEVVLEKGHRRYLPTTQCNMPEDQGSQAWDCQVNYSWRESWNNCTRCSEGI